MEVFHLYCQLWPTATIVIGQSVMVLRGKTYSLLGSSLVGTFCHVVEGENPNTDDMQTLKVYYDTK